MVPRSAGAVLHSQIKEMSYFILPLMQTFIVSAANFRYHTPVMWNKLSI